MLHYHIPEMRDVEVANIPKMQMVTFVTSDAKNFLIVGSISQAMLSKVPTNHPIIKEYLKVQFIFGLLLLKKKLMKTKFQVRM